MKTIIAILLAFASTTLAQTLIPAAPSPRKQVVATPRVLLSGSASQVVIAAASTLTGQDLAKADNVLIQLVGSGTGASCKAFVITGLPSSPKSKTIPEAGTFSPTLTTAFLNSILPVVTLADWTSAPLAYYGARLIHSGTNNGKIEVFAGYVK